LTNDDWIMAGPENSLAALAIGHDYRNYWRGDRFRGTLTHTWTAGPGQFALGAGAETERDWSVRAGGPWSITGSEARDGMLRPNPVIEHGRISLVIGTALAAFQFGDVKLSGDVNVERPFDTPLGERFTQTTFNADVAPFIKDAASRSGLPTSSYLAGAEFGFELYDYPGTGFAVTSYTFDVK